MKRDAWYAGIAASGLLAIAAAYALFSAPKLADVKVALARSKLTASLPAPPTPYDDTVILGQAKTILRELDPFSEQRSQANSSTLSLNLPKLGAPVQFSDPSAQATVIEDQPAAPYTPILQPQTLVPQAPMPSAPERISGTLTLRGVFPTANGGRALVAMPNGRVASVGVGGIVGGWRVLQIQQGAIRLGRGQRVILLAMPEQ